MSRIKHKKNKKWIYVLKSERNVAPWRAHIMCNVKYMYTYYTKAVFCLTITLKHICVYAWKYTHMYVSVPTAATAAWVDILTAKNECRRDGVDERRKVRPDQSVMYPEESHTLTLCKNIYTYVWMWACVLLLAVSRARLLFFILLSRV